VIVLGGCAAVEEAAGRRATTIEVPFTPGRTDATEEMTDAESFAVLEPTDGFRNYLTEGKRTGRGAAVDRANLLTLTAPEMTVLVGGLRVLGANTGQSSTACSPIEPGVLTNDFFVNLLDMGTSGRRLGEGEYVSRVATARVASSSGPPPRRPRSSARTPSSARREVYASSDAKQKFVNDFVAAWTRS
jgi:catalase-peroxidase